MSDDARTMIAAALLAIGCTENDPDDAAPRDTAAQAVDTATRDRGQAPEPGSAPFAPERPETREDTVLLEGTAEVERATLVRSPAGFGIPFSTYVSNGLRTEFQTERAGASVRFSAAFGGVANRNAYMQVYLYEEGVQRPAVREVVAGFVC